MKIISTAFKQSQATTSLHAPDGKHHHDLKKYTTSDSNGGNLQTQVEIIGTSYSQHHMANDARPIFNHLQPCG